MKNSPPGASASRLTGLILDTPLGQRASLMMAAVSFRRSRGFEHSFRVGPVRAAFAEYWELTQCSLIPLKEISAVLRPPIRIGTVLEFNKFDYLCEPTEIERQLSQLVSHLVGRTRELQANRQKSLFADGVSTTTEEPSSSTPGQTVSSLQTLVDEGRKFPTVYADPPWPYTNEASRAAAINHYPVMGLDQIRSEPVSKLAADDAHLHLWTTNAFLREAFEVIEAWGFTFKSCLVWVKNELGMGNYWRVSHEFLLLGVRGSLTFRDRTLPSWLLAERTSHSHKPARIRILIERVSIGPFLELYGREELPNSNWTVYGNQIEKRLF